jgi:hypothetical protein
VSIACPALSASLRPPDPAAWWLARPGGPPPRAPATARATGDPAAWWLTPGGPPSAPAPPTPCAPGDTATWWLASPPHAPAHPSGPPAPPDPSRWRYLLDPLCDSVSLD